MTPKEKAKDLIEKFTDPTKVPNMVKNIWVEDIDSAKHCALIAVNEILKQCEDVNFSGFGLYWEEVKSEIEII